MAIFDARPTWPRGWVSALAVTSLPARAGERQAREPLCQTWSRHRQSTIRRKDGFLAVRFERHADRRGYPKALVATEHAMIIGARTPIIR